MYGYNQQSSINMINQKIAELENLKTNYQNMPQQPIQNIINTGNSQNSSINIRILNENEDINEILVTNKTFLISPKNMYLKDVDGTILEKYDIKKTYPIDPKDEEIERLKEEIYELKHNKAINDIKKSSTNDTEYNEPTTKGNGTSISKQPK